MENKIQSDIQTRPVCSKVIPNQYCLYTQQQYSTWPNSLDHWLFVALTSNLGSVPWVLLSLEFPQSWWPSWYLFWLPKRSVTVHGTSLDGMLWDGVQNLGPGLESWSSHSLWQGFYMELRRRGAGVGGECMIPWWKYEKMWQLKTWVRALNKYYNVEYTVWGGRAGGIIQTWC